MKHIKLFEQFINENKEISFKISYEKDGSYEKTDIVINIHAGNSGFVGTAKGIYNKKKVDATIFYGYDDQCLSIEDENLSEEDIEMLTDIIDNDDNFIENINK